MRIETSYYDNIKNIDKDKILISISGDISKEIKDKIDLWDKRLAPSWSIYKEYTETKDEILYTKRFYKEILEKRNLLNIINEWIAKFGKDKTYVLLCYEEEGLFCHRHLVYKEFKILIDKNQ